MSTQSKEQGRRPGAGRGSRRASGLLIDATYMMAESIGPEHGLTPSALRLAHGRACRAHERLHAHRGPGEDKLGWIDLPRAWREREGARELARLERCAERLRRLGDRHLILGIGGSSRGASAILGALASHGGSDPSPRGRPGIYFGGHNLDADALGETLDFLVAGARARRDAHPFTVEVVSKSGGTLETAVAFRFVRDALERLYGKRYGERVVAITDPEEGSLRRMARAEGYEAFDIPPDVGGRYSVLSAVGLLPAAVAGVPVRALLDGARAAAERCCGGEEEENPALAYAALMNLSVEAGRTVTYLYCWNDALFSFGEWHDQLVAESLGKEGRGRIPVTTVVPRDLHARGQMVQEGPRNAVIVHLRAERPGRALRLPRRKADDDGLGYLGGKALADLGRASYEGTALAYAVDGRPGLTVRVPRLDAFSLGELFYFFEWATAVEGYLMGINPFDQPGVEAYKSFMYSLLGREDAKGMQRKLRALGQEVLAPRRSGGRAPAKS